jgi:hypothetical protein
MARHRLDQNAAQSWTPARPHRSHCPSPATAASRSKSETVPPVSQKGVMRPARVIIKLESGLNGVEFLAADNLCVAFLGQRDETCDHVGGLNDALTNQRLWLTIP